MKISGKFFWKILLFLHFGSKWFPDANLRHNRSSRTTCGYFCGGDLWGRDQGWGILILCRLLNIPWTWFSSFSLLHSLTRRSKKVVYVLLLVEEEVVHCEFKFLDEKEIGGSSLISNMEFHRNPANRTNMFKWTAFPANLRENEYELVYEIKWDWGHTKSERQLAEMRYTISVIIWEFCNKSNS